MTGIQAGIMVKQYGITLVPSNIDVTIPPEGMAKTADVRANFQTASDEITNLQDRVAALEAAVTRMVTANLGTTRGAE